jgi:hypothetical protein
LRTIKYAPIVDDRLWWPGGTRGEENQAGSFWRELYTMVDNAVVYSNRLSVFRWVDLDDIQPVSGVFLEIGLYLLSKFYILRIDQ